MASGSPLQLPSPTALWLPSPAALWLPSPTALWLPSPAALWLPSPAALWPPSPAALWLPSPAAFSNCVGSPSRAQRGTPFGLWRWLQMALQLHQVKMWRLRALSWRNASVIPQWIAANNDTRWKRACNSVHRCGAETDDADSSVAARRRDFANRCPRDYTEMQLLRGSQSPPPGRCRVRFKLFIVQLCMRQRSVRVPDFVTNNTIMYKYYARTG